MVRRQKLDDAHGLFPVHDLPHVRTVRMRRRVSKTRNRDGRDQLASRGNPWPGSATLRLDKDLSALG